MELLNNWGLTAQVDIKGCDSGLVRSREAIQDYVIQLCKLIEMKRHGDVQIIHFGEDERVAGYSMVQFIETSLISGHFANATDSAYIDIFSCKAFNPALVAEFTKEFFKAAECDYKVSMRK